MLSFDNILGDPIFETLKVDILNCSRTFAQTYQRIDTVITIFKAYSANFIKTTDSAHIRYAFDFDQIIMESTVRLKISLCHLFFLLYNLFESKFDFSKFDKSAILDGM